MKLSTFIKRPVFSGVISVLIVLVGVIGIKSLPIEQYPDIAPPTIEVTTMFFGADASAILNSVILPLEDAINGVENMIYMNSTAANTGDVTIQVVFKQGSNPDMDCVNVQNRVQKALSVLPAEVKNYGVEVKKKQNSMLQIFTLNSPDDTFDEMFLNNYASINIKPKIMLVNGVGEFQMLGTDYAIRVWLDPDAMAQHNLNPSDVSSMLTAQNFESATGTLGSDSDEAYQYTMKYTGRLKEVSQFENIILRSDTEGNILRLKDVARIELGIMSYNFTSQTNGHPGVMCIAYQAAGSNATQVNTEIDAVLDQAIKDAPSGVKITKFYNTNDFLYASIEQVLETLRDAIILVILVVMIFLKDWRSTLIPFISILVSLIGTFAFMMVAGFSLNLLTLFALVLVIGTVVDDAIVVVEAVNANFEAGETDSTKATKKAINEVAKPVLTSSLVFMAVFIPVSFTGGTSGVFYRQFGLTMAVAVGISALNSLTTVPALCALLLKPMKKPEPGQKPTLMQRYAIWFDGLFERFGKSYKGGVEKAIHLKPVLWGLIIVGGLVLMFCMKMMPSGLVPEEDKGLAMVEMTLPPGSSLHSTRALMDQVCEEIRGYEGIAEVCGTAGYGFIAGNNASAAIIICKLDPWDERDKDHTYEKIRARLALLGNKYKQANFMAFTTPMIPGYGTSSGVEMYIQDRRGGTLEELLQVSNDFLAELRKIGIVGFSAFNLDYPQWEVSVDVAKCIRYGLTPQTVVSTVGSYYGSTYISDVNLYAKVYKVMMQGESDTRRDEFSLNRTYIRTGNGEMAPLSNFVSLKRIYGPDNIKNFNKFTAVNVSIVSALSDGEVLQILADYEKQYLPEGYTLDFGGMSREQSNQGGLGLILVICIFIIYLILAALYESLVIPFAVLLPLPLGLAGSYGISLLFGLDNNIYVQTGVIMLIGLLSKTAILITEYAVDRHKRGMETNEASVDAAVARLRPIIMTVATMSIGLAPLVMSINGVGGKGNFSLGLGTICGLIIGTVGLLFITPAMYTTFQKLQDKMVKPGKDDDDDE